jgi:hypothetical protein
LPGTPGGAAFERGNVTSQGTTQNYETEFPVETFNPPSAPMRKGLFGEEDGLKLDLLGGDAVAGNIQGAFNAFQMPGRLKRFTMVRPVFITEQAPGVKLRMNTQYSFTSVAGTPSFSGTTFSEWDTAVWGIAKWSGVSNTYESWFGVSGLGYYGAVRMRVKGLGGSTTLSSYHVLYEPGGIM